MIRYLELIIHKDAYTCYNKPLMNQDMGTSLLDDILQHENLYWAWEKAKKYYGPGELWFNDYEVAMFEGNLEIELNNLKKEIKDDNYKMQPLQIIAVPKAPKEGKPQLRQAFWVSVRDQLIWIATANILGKYFEPKMPSWSYGNRLYRTVWYNWEGNRKIPKFGAYRNTTGYVYRKWHQSWPLYRKEIRMTLTAMSNRNNGKAPKFDDEKLVEHYEIQSDLPSNQRLPYLEPSYWRSQTEQYYWGGFDLEKFFPSIPTDFVLKIILEEIGPGSMDDELRHFLSKILSFEVDASGWSSADLELMGLPIPVNPGYCKFEGLPTGLLVSGFLSNIAMLRVDQLVADELKNNNKIAHFRFVDDHFILASDFDAMIEWIEAYESKLKAVGLDRLKINSQKYEPKLLGKFLENKTESNKKEAEESCAIDPELPSPLLTSTLERVSQLANQEIEMLDEDAENQMISDLEFLLSTEIPDHEIREDTRVSFAASFLARVISRYRPDVEKIAGLKIRALKESDPREREKTELELAQAKLTQEKKIEARHEKSFKLILKGISQFPDKRRLWSKALYFCFSCGYDGISKLLDLLDKLVKNNLLHKLSKEYYFAVFCRELIVLTVSAYQLLAMPDAEEFRRRRALKFLKMSIGSAKILETLVAYKGESGEVPNYLSISQELLRASISAMLFIGLKWEKVPSVKLMVEIEKTDKLKKVDNSWYGKDVHKELISSVKKTFKPLPLGAGAFEDGLTEYQLIKKRTELFWLIAYIRNGELDNLILPLWRHVALFQDWSDTRYVGMLSIHPGIVPKVTVQGLLNESESGRVFRLTNHEGQMFDLLKAQKKKGWKDLLKGDKISKPLRKAITSQKQTLVDWVLELRKIETNILPTRENRFAINYDPRLSEWTALEIVSQIAQSIDDSSKKLDTIDVFLLGNQSYKIHPSNYEIPREWLELTTGSPLSWEKWEQVMKADQIKIKMERDLIHDNRFVPLFQRLDITSIESWMQHGEYPIVMGLGSILFGLIRKNFALPSSWNSDGLRSSSNQMIGEELRKSPISSKTLAILRASRSKVNQEILYFRKSKTYEVIDVDRDLVEQNLVIDSIPKLIECIKESQAVLKQNRTGTHEYAPRQLIPINLQQLGDFRNPFSTIENIEEHE